MSFNFRRPISLASSGMFSRLSHTMALAAQQRKVYLVGSLRNITGVLSKRFYSVDKPPSDNAAKPLESDKSKLEDVEEHEMSDVKKAVPLKVEEEVQNKDELKQLQVITKSMTDLAKMDVAFQDKQKVQKPTETPTKLFSPPSSSMPSDEDLGGYNKFSEDSWRTMKYSMMAVGVSLAAVGSYLVYEFGKPDVDSDGHEIMDEFYKLPTWQQYLARTVKCIEHYNRLIIEPSREKLLPDELSEPYEQPRYTLVLELIDVLVHPDWTYNTGWRFKKRPGLDYFLDALSRIYEIVIYTARPGLTAFPIIDAIDPKNCISYKLVRDATHFVDGHHVKNLDRLNRRLESIVVVDWDMDAVKFHPENVFRIPRWSGNDDDTTLFDLADFLGAVAGAGIEDVREVLRYYADFDDGLEVFKERRDSYVKQVAESRKKTGPAVFNIPKQHNFNNFVLK